MGLLDFDKMNNLKSPAEFYKECIEDFHKEANEHGVATRGLIFIPELIPLGEKTILAYLRDPYYITESNGAPEVFYYTVMHNSLKAGMALATQWHEDVSKLDEYVDEVILDGPAIMGYCLLKKYFSEEIYKNFGEEFYKKIYARWLALHEPYWALEDPRIYTFNAMLAAYQLGVSMILEKYGY